MMTRCLQAISRAISVGENIVEAEPIAPLGAVFVEHVERTTSRPNVNPKKRHTMSKLRKAQPARKKSSIV